MPIISPLPRTSPISGCLSCSSRSPAIRCAPTAAALATSESCSSSIVASAAAHDTGLPPNVLACAPGGHAITSALAQVTPSGRPEAMPLAMVTTSAFRPKCSDANIFPVRPMPDCTSSTTRSDPVLGGELAQPLVELPGRHEVAALALDRLDDDGGDFVRGDEVDEQLVLEEAEALGLRRSRAAAERTAIAVGVRRVVDAGASVGPKPRRCTALLAVSDSEPSVRPWNGAEERDEARPLRV